MHCSFKSAAALLLGFASLHGAQAADTLPADLTGNWRTVATETAGTRRQIYLQLDADGFGVLVGTNDAASGSRTMIASKLRAVLDGDTLTTRMIAFSGASAAEATQAEKMTLTCRHVAPGVALVCNDPNGVLIDLRQVTDPLPAEIATMIATVRERR